MNIVYKLTNTSKKEGTRFYIGSKQSCTVIEIDGIPTIINKGTGKPYYSSSQSLEFRTDFQSGDIFSAEVLESGINRKDLLEVEDKWISYYNAVESKDFYNLSNAKLNCHDQSAICNVYGEVVSQLASNNSQMSKRDNTATSLGFKNMGELCFNIEDQRREGKDYATISRGFGKKRHFARMYTQPFNMEKAYEDLKRVDCKKNFVK